MKNPEGDDALSPDSATFATAADIADVGIENAQATDLASETADQDQNFVFEITGEDLGGGQQITIDLTDTGGVSYSDLDSDYTSTNGSVSITDDTLTFEAYGLVFGQVVVSASNGAVDTSGVADETFTVDFTVEGSGATTTADFTAGDLDSVGLGAPADINSTNQTDHTVNGTGEPGATVEVTWDDGDGNTVSATSDPVDANGDWNVFEDVSGLTDTANGDNVTITATQDVDGSTDSTSVTKDTTEPTVESASQTTVGDFDTFTFGFDEAVIVRTTGDFVIYSDATCDVVNVSGASVDGGDGSNSVDITMDGPAGSDGDTVSARVEAGAAKDDVGNDNEQSDCSQITLDGGAG